MASVRDYVCTSSKANSELPRVQRVLGSLRRLAPDNLLDIGSGRGTFLWPLLAAFLQLPVTSVDSSERRTTDAAAVGHSVFRELCGKRPRSSRRFGHERRDWQKQLNIL